MAKIALFFLFVFSLSPSGFADKGTSLRIGTTKALPNLSPEAQRPGESDYLRNFIQPPVVALGPDWQWRCIVCTTLPTTANGLLKLLAPPARGMSARFSIDPKWHWGDGTPVSGRDVAYTFSVLKGRLADPLFRFNHVLQVTVDRKDPRQFTIELSHLRADFQTLLAISLMPAHLQKKIEAGAYRTDPTNKGLYYGKYLPENVTPSQVTLTAQTNDAGIGTIILLSLPSTEALVQAATSGEIDMVRDGDLSIPEAMKLNGPQAAKGAELRLVTATTHVIEHLVINTRNPTLADPALRHALFFAIDRDRIIAEVYRNFAIKADQLYHPRDPFAATGLKVVPYDLKMANDLLNAAGWPMGEGGVRRKNGQALNLVIDTTEDPERRQIFEIIKRSWRAVGVDVSISAHTRESFFKNIIARSRFRDIALLAWDQIPATGLWLALHSREIPTSENGYSGSNVGTFSRREADSLLLTLFRSTNPVAAKAAAQSLMTLYTTELPTLPLAFKPIAALIPIWLENFQLPGHHFASSLNASGWRKAPSFPEKLF